MYSPGVVRSCGLRDPQFAQLLFKLSCKLPLLWCDGGGFTVSYKK